MSSQESLLILWHSQVHSPRYESSRCFQPRYALLRRVTIQNLVGTHRLNSGTASVVCGDGEEQDQQNAYVIGLLLAVFIQTLSYSFGRIWKRARAATDDKIHTTDLPLEQQESCSGCNKELKQEACKEDFVQAACNLMEETINELDNVSHERDRLRIENQLLKVDLREAVAQNLASEAEKFEMESEAASEEDATVRPVQNVTPVNHRSQIPVLTWN